MTRPTCESCRWCWDNRRREDSLALYCVAWPAKTTQISVYRPACIIYTPTARDAGTEDDHELR